MMSVGDVRCLMRGPEIVVSSDTFPVRVRVQVLLVWIQILVWVRVRVRIRVRVLHVVETGVHTSD